MNDTPKKSLYLIPNAFTSFNVLFGFASIVMSSQAEYDLAMLFIGLAAICDTLDGLMARLTKAVSKFGVELDSLADCVSFGAAPAYLIYKTHLFIYDYWGIFISGLLLLFGAYRLARFNVQISGFEKTEFSGLPIPFSALTVTAYVFGYHQDGVGFITPFDKFVIPLVVLLSLLMVSKITYPTLPKFTLEGLKSNPLFVIYIIAAGGFVLISGIQHMFFALLIFIFMGIFGTTKKFVIKQEASASE